LTQGTAGPRWADGRTHYGSSAGNVHDCIADWQIRPRQI